MNNKFLIIEDDANILYSLQAKLRTNGSDVEIFNGSGTINELVNLVEKFRPNYIILDLILPNLEGFEILKILKNQVEKFDSHVFVFTNMSDKDTRLKAENLGINNFFIKTDFNIDEFVEKINKIIENRIKVNNNKK
jgi:DNA-binding response OmpR family regulator